VPGSTSQPQPQTSTPSAPQMSTQKEDAVMKDESKPVEQIQPKAREEAKKEEKKEEEKKEAPA